jgi:hypothetical protein
MPSSLALHDFLLAAMIISLDLYESRNRSASISPEDLKTQVDKYDALRLSYDILTSRKAFSRDALRASNVLAVMLSKVTRPNILSTPLNAPQKMSSMPQASVNGGDIAGLAMNSPGALSWNTNMLNILDQELQVDNSSLSDLNSEDLLNTIFSGPDNIDWVSLRGPSYAERCRLISL